MTKMIYIFLLLFSLNVYSIEKVEVTGSRVKRIDVEGPAPILILDKEDLEKSGYNSVGDVLRDTTIAPFGLGREASGGDVAGESFIGLHGARTLILLNGKRVVEDPNAEAVDLNLIPIFAVERVEIVKDGSSSLYGSDALGGVINFVMKKNYEGTKFYGRYTYPFQKGGSRLEIASVVGKVFPQGSVTGVLQYRFNNKIFAVDRSWSADLKSPTSPYGVFKPPEGEAGAPFLNPACPKGDRNERGDTCWYKFSKISTTLPSISQLSSYIQGNYKSRGMTFYNQSLFSYKDVSYTYAPIPGEITISAENASKNRMSLIAGRAGSLVYRFEDAGNRDTYIKSLVFDVTSGARGYLSSTWDWDANLKLARVSKNETTHNLLLKEEITQLILNNKYDPMKVKGQRGDLSSALYNTLNKNTSNLVSASVDLSGEYSIFGLAVGAQAFHTNYKEVSDEKLKNGLILSASGSDGSGDRQVFSLYQEAVIPYKTLEVQATLRSDYYSDFGLSANPKGAFRWQPVSSFLMRGSAGTAFVAPSMHSLYGSFARGYPTLIDTVACYSEAKANSDFKALQTTHKKDDDFVKEFVIDQRKTFNDKSLSEEVKTELKQVAENMNEREYCKPRQYVAISGGNKELKETKAIVASLGTVWQVSSGISFALDGWYINTSGSPTSGVSKDAVDAELKFGKEYVKDKGVTITRSSNKAHNPILNSAIERLDSEGKKIDIVGMESGLLNIGSSKIAGLDASLNVELSRWNLYGGNFYVHGEGTVIAFSSAEGFPGMGFTDNIGKSGLPRWRTISTLGWRNSQHEVTLKSHSVASVGKVANELENIPHYTRLDLSYQWAMDSKTNFNVGWSNVLSSVPPLDDTVDNSSKIDEALHEVRGSYIYVGFNRTL